MTDRKSGSVGHANAARATSVPTAPAARPTARKKQWRVEVWKTTSNKFALYQTYTDKSVADNVLGQLQWVGARCRIIAA